MDVSRCAENYLLLSTHLQPQLVGPSRPSYGHGARSSLNAPCILSNTSWEKALVRSRTGHLPNVKVLDPSRS